MTHVPRATIIGSVDQSYTEALVDYVEKQCGVRNVDFILGLDLDEALAGNRQRLRTEVIYAVRDNVRTKLVHSLQRGSRSCFVIGKVDRSPNEIGFGTSAHQVIRGRQQVDEWGIMRDVRSACVTPDGLILPVR